MPFLNCGSVWLLLVCCRVIYRLLRLARIRMLESDCLLLCHVILFVLLAFGRDAGRCIGECHEIYKVSPLCCNGH
jgi:hypothetical protein